MAQYSPMKQHTPPFIHRYLPLISTELAKERVKNLISSNSIIIVQTYDTHLTFEIGPKEVNLGSTCKNHVYRKNKISNEVEQNMQQKKFELLLSSKGVHRLVPQSCAQKELNLFCPNSIPQHLDSELRSSSSVFNSLQSCLNQRKITSQFDYGEADSQELRIS